jgi:hypothetical protein
MNSYELLDSMATALADDSVLAANATTWYGVEHQVFIDHDQADPPGEDDGFALLHLHSPAKIAAEDNEIVEYAFILSIDVQDPAQATRAESNASEFAATARLDAMANRSIAVVRAAKPGDFVMGYEYYTDTVNNFPAFTADILIEFKQRVLIGQDPLA